MKNRTIIFGIFLIAFFAIFIIARPHAAKEPKKIQNSEAPATIMFRLLSERITQIEAGWTKPLARHSLWDFK